MRVNRAAHELGVATVAIFSEADRTSLHVRNADEAYCVGPGAVARSYLNIPNIISAALISGADAIHPGYGFLAENARFAEICADHGLTFIGPSPDTYLEDGRQGDRQGDHARGQECRRRPAPTFCTRSPKRCPRRRSSATRSCSRRRRAAAARGCVPCARPKSSSTPSRPRKPKPRRISKTAGSTWKSSSSGRGTSKCR